jgi:hypothetical protein
LLRLTKEITMNANFNTQLVERLSKLDDEALKERTVLKIAAREQLIQGRERAERIWKQEGEIASALKAEIANAEACVQGIQDKILAEEEERRTLQAYSVNCPVPTLQALYAEKADSIKDQIEGLKSLLQETFKKIEDLKNHIQLEETAAEKELEKFNDDPTIGMWMNVAASVRKEIMHWIDVGRYVEADQAARMEGDAELLEEVHEQINAKRVAVSAAKKTLYQPQMLDLPKKAWALGHKGEVVIAIDRSRKECARFAVSPRGQIYPLRTSNRRWTAEGGVHFSPIHDLVRSGGRRPAMTARAA